MIDYTKLKIQKLDDEVWPVGDAADIKPFFKLWKTIQGKCGRGTLEVEPAWASFRRFYEWASLEAPYREEMELLFGSPEKDFFNTPSWRLKTKMSSNPASEIKEGGAFFITKRLMEELMDVWVILSIVARGEDPYGEKPDYPAMERMVKGNLAKLQTEYGNPEHAAGLKAHLTKLVGLLEQHSPATEKLVIRPVITTVPEGLPTIASAGTPTPTAQSQDCWDYLTEIAEAIARACEYGGEDVASEAIYNHYFELQDEYLWDHLQIRHWEYGTIREPLEDMVRGIESPEQRLNTIAAAVTAAATTTNRLADSQRRMEAELLDRRLVELRHSRQLEELTTADATLRQLVMDNQAQVTSEFEKVWETLDASAQAMKALSDAVHRIEESLVAEKRDRLMSFPTGVKQALTPPSKLNPLGEAVQAAAPQADAEAYKWVKPVIDKAVEPEAAAPVSQQEVVIIGLLGPQARDIETRLGDKFAFTFYSTDTKSQRLQNGCKDKVVVVMTGFMAHRTYEAVKKVASRIVHSNGGISGLERDLTELYGSLTANAA